MFDLENRQTLSHHRTEKSSWVIPLLLITTLFQNYSDIISVMNGESLKLMSFQGSIYLKLMKDATYLLILLAILYASFRRRESLISPPSLIIILVASGQIFLSFIENGAISAAIGIRWFIPLLIFLLAKQWIAHLPMGGINFWIGAGLILNISAQIYQMFFMPPIYGLNIFGLSARSPGLFIAPNSGAFLSCALAALATVTPARRGWLPTIAPALALLSSGLAQSGTGLVVAMALLLRSVLGRSRVVFWSVGLLAMTYVAFNLDALTMREGFVQESGGGRVEILLRVAEEGLASVTNFGLYTNASVLANEFGTHRGVADSLLASWIGNFGLMAFPVALVLGVFCIKNMRPLGADYAFAPLVTFFLFSGTTIVFEAYPMNIILVISIWLAVDQSKARQVIYDE